MRNTQQAQPPAPHVGLDAESKLRAVFDALVDPVVILSAVRDESGTIVDFRYMDANPAACAYNGLPHDALVGTTVLDLLPGHTATGLLDMYIAVVETGESLMLDDYPYLSELWGEERLYDIRAMRVDDPLLVEHLLLSLREMLSNVARHAHAHAVEVKVVVTAAAVELVVTDDGVGLDDVITKGYGLSNLAKRAALLGGAFSMVGRPQGGVCARWRVPRTPLGHMLAAS